MIPRGARPLALAALPLLGPLLTVDAASAAPRVYDAPSAGEASTHGRPLAIPAAPAEYLSEDRGWITFVYHPSTRDRVRPLIARADVLRADLSALLGREALTQRVEVRVAAAHAELGHLAPAVELGDATAASFGELRLAVLSAAPRLSLDPPELEGVLRHALAHLALDEATGGAAVPRWLHEGFAAQAAGDRAALRAQTLCLAALRGRLAPLSDLESLLPAPAEAAAPSIAYAEAADFTRFLLEPARRDGFAAFVEHARDGAPLPEALARAYGAGLPELELAWRQDVARRYGFLPVLVGALALIALLCAGAFGLRRLRERRPVPISPRRRIRAEQAEQSARASSPSRPSPPPPAPTPSLASRARRRAELEGDDGVPKVEHGGRWHTLH